MTGKLVTVAGGSGFVGRHVVRALCARGYVVRVLCRDTVDAAFLKPCGAPGQVVLQYADFAQPETLAGACKGSFAVVNLVGTLHSRGKHSFKAIHTEGAEALAKEAAEAGALRFVQVSALGVDRADATYARSKLEGEARVHAAFPTATLLRPSLIVGIGDGFFERFARLSQLSPVLPLLRGGRTRFQPVLAEDVAKAVVAAIEHADAPGKIYALAGPKAYSFRELLEALLAETGRTRCLLPIPTPIAYLQAACFECLPFTPPFTRDQLRMLRTDAVADNDLPGFAALDIAPASLESALPAILKRYKAHEC